MIDKLMIELLTDEAYEAGQAYLASCRHYQTMLHPIPLDAVGIEGLFNGILEVHPDNLTDAERDTIVAAYNRGASGQ